MKLYSKLFSKLLFSGLLLIAPLCSVSFAANTGESQLNHFLKNSKGFMATFSQSLFDENGIELQFSAGRFSLQKPGKFSWDYEEPYHQIIMSNGKVIWMFDSELEQVTIKPVDASLSKTSMVLLFDDTDLKKDFKIIELDVVKNVSWLELVSKDSSAEFSHIMIGLKDNRIVGIRLIDGFNQTTEIKFTDINTTPNFKENRFEFNIPRNVDVIGGE